MNPPHRRNRSSTASETIRRGEQMAEIISNPPYNNPNQLYRPSPVSYSDSTRSFTSLVELNIIRTTLVNIKHSRGIHGLKKDESNRNFPPYTTRVSIIKNSNSAPKRASSQRYGDDDLLGRYAFAITKFREKNELPQYIDFKDLQRVHVTQSKFNPKTCYSKGLESYLPKGLVGILHCVFSHSQVSLEFLHDHECQFFSRFLSMLLQYHQALLRSAPLRRGISEVTRGRRGSDLMYMDMFEEDLRSAPNSHEPFIPLNKLQPGIATSPQSPSGQPSTPSSPFRDLSSWAAFRTGDRVMKEFLSREYSDWERKHVIIWLKHVLYQNQPGTPVITLHEYLQRHPPLLDNLLSYLESFTLKSVEKQLDIYEDRYSRHSSRNIHRLHFTPKKRKKNTRSNPSSSSSMGDGSGDRNEYILPKRHDSDGNIPDETIRITNIPSNSNHRLSEKRTENILGGNYIHPKNTEEDELSRIGLDERLLPLIEKKTIRETLKNQMDLLQQRGGKFSLMYYRVLHKRVKARESRSGPALDLRDLKHKMKFKERVLWDSDECRDQIIFALLFNNQMRTYIRTSEEKFLRLERENFYSTSSALRDEISFQPHYRQKKTKNDDDDDEEEESGEDSEANELLNKMMGMSEFIEESEKVCHIDSKSYRKFLEEFNESVGYQMERVSFRVYLRREQNKLRIKKENVEQEIKDRHAELAEGKRMLGDKELRIRHLDEKLMQFSEKLLEMEDESKVSLFQRQLECLSRRLEKLQEEKEQWRIKVSKLETKLLDPTVLSKYKKKIRWYCDKIKDCVYELRKPLKFRFLLSQERRDEIREMIRSQIVSLAREQKRFDVKVKLVLAIERKRRQRYDRNRKNEIERLRRKRLIKKRKKKLLQQQKQKLQKSSSINKTKEEEKEDSEEEDELDKIVREEKEKKQLQEEEEEEEEENENEKKKKKTGSGSRGNDGSGYENSSLLKYLKLFDGKIFNPTWFRYGFAHSSLIIKNCQIHWFSNHLIYIKPDLSVDDAYDDIVCLDADCVDLMVLDYMTLFRKIQVLAKTMVHWNAYYYYSEWNIFSKDKQKNCQEFTVEMLRALNSVEFYPEVERYIERFKKVVNDLGTIKKTKKKKKNNINKRKNKDDEESSEEEEEEGFFEEQRKMEELRFVTLSPEFCESNPDVLNKYSYMITHDDDDSHNNNNNNNNNRNNSGVSTVTGKTIVFKTHEEIDHFVRFCRARIKEFDLKYAGLVSLLKGFDRAYWLRYRKMKEEDEASRPSKFGCAFSHNYLVD